MKVEKWKNIKSYENIYMVSTFGNIKSLDRIVNKSNGIVSNVKGKTISIANKNRRYKSVTLSNSGKYKSFDVHRLVAEAFIPNKENKPQVNHIDGNKHNNNSDNLEWCTSIENIQHAVRTGLMKKSRRGEKNHKRARKLSDKQVLDIKNNKKHYTAKELSKKHDISTHSIYNIWSNRTWSEII